MHLGVKHNDVHTSVDIEFCMFRDKIRHFPVEANQQDILEFARSSDNYFSQEEGSTACYLTLNSKRKILAKKFSFECNYLEPSLEVRFIENVSDHTGNRNILHSEIPILKNSFEFAVDELTFIDSISVKVNSLDKPFGIAFYDSSGEENRSFVLVVSRCGVLEFDNFHTYWAGVNFILGCEDSYGKKLFRGTIKGDYLEELF